MFDLFGWISEDIDSERIRKEFFSLSCQLEKTTVSDIRSENEYWCDNVLQKADKLYNLVSKKNIRLAKSDKIRIVKILNRVKVRALLSGSTDGRRVYRSLERMGSDIMPYL